MLSVPFPTMVVGRGSIARQLVSSLEQAGARVVGECAAGELAQRLADSEAEGVVIVATGSLAELQVAERALVAIPRAQRPVALVVVSPRTLGQLQPSQVVDDFVLWPCSGEEVVMRLWMARWRRAGIEGTGLVRSGDLVVDVERHRVVVAGREVHLTVREYELLNALLRARGRVLSRQELLDEVWGPQYLGGPRTVDIHIRRLRAKMPEIADRIVTVRGVGYRLKVPSE